ncbi:condensation domain-containing protein, partial [uncultured Brevundimonas sp.]
LWFLAQLEGSAAPDGVQSATYNVTAALGLDGALDETALRAALCALTARHESLRMNVRTEAGQPVLLLREAYDPLIVEDLALETGEDRDAVLRARAAAHAAAPFDLATEPLLRLTLLRIGESRQVLLVNLHHIAADGWSLGVLVRDLSALYAAALADEPCALPPLPVQYADYAAWQRDWLSGAVLEQQIAYWRDRLADAPALLELPADRPRPATRTCRGGHRALTLAPELTDRLEAFSRAKGVTLFMTLLAGFKTLLHRYSGQQDILVGSPIANRTHAQTEELVGFFVNTLVLRSTVTRETSFEALLSRVRETALDAYAHQDLPFETLVNELQPERSLSHSPLFQVMFALQNAPQEELRLGDAVIQTLAPDLGTAKFDLTLSIEAGPQGLTCNWEYAGDLFDPSRIDRMAAHYSTLLESLLAAPEAPAGTLPLLTEAERAELAGWAGGAVSYPREASLADLFGEIVAAAPDAPALRLGKTTLSYTELDDRAGRLAAYIDAH